MSATKPQADVDLIVHMQSAMTALAAFEGRMKRMFDTIERSAKGVGNSTQTANDGFQNWIVSLGKIAATSFSLIAIYKSVEVIVSAIRREMDATIQTAQKAKQSQSTFNEALADVHYTLTPDSDISIDQIRERILNSPSPFKDAIARSARTAISADLESPISERLDTVLQIADIRGELLRSNPEEFNALVESVILARRAYGGTVREQVGSMQTAASVARPISIGHFAQHLGGTMPIMKQFGFNQDDALAFVSALSVAMNDRTGETTRTNAYTFVAQLEEELKSRGIMIQGGDMLDYLAGNEAGAQEVRMKLASYLRSGLTPQELEELQAAEQDPKIEGRARGKVALIQMLEPGGAKGPEHMQTLFALAREKVLTGKEAGEYTDRLQAELESQDWYQTLRAEYATENYKARRKLSPAMGMRGVTAGFLEDFRELGGSSANYAAIVRLMDTWRMTGTDPSGAKEAAAIQTNAAMELADRLRGQGYLNADPVGIGQAIIGRDLKGPKTVTGPDGRQITYEEALATANWRDPQIVADLKDLILVMQDIKEILKGGIPVEEKNKPVQAPKQPAAAGR